MNELLRDHVTSGAFALTLGKSHVAELVRIDIELTAGTSLDYATLRGTNGGLHRCDMTARHGLTRRGLIVHTWPLNEHKYMKPASDGTGRMVRDLDRTVRPGERWNITRAGRLVIDLLKESGLYSEYAGPLMALVERRRARAAS